MITHHAYSVNVESVAAFSVNADMLNSPAEIAPALRIFIDRAGLSQERFAHLMGMRRASSVQRYFTEQRTRWMPWDWVLKAADVLAGLGRPPITREEVLDLAGPREPDAFARGGNATDPEISIVQGNFSPYAKLKDLPILGQARTGDDSYIFENGVPARAFTVRPMELVGVSDAYAVYVHGESMHPRYKHGELAYVDPSRPVQPGDDVVIQLNDGQGFIKELVRRTSRTVYCRQHNPPEGQTKEVEFPAVDVRSIHLIIFGTKTRV